MTLPDLSDLAHRHNLNLMGSGAATLLFVHGYGCNQSMWRHVAPALAHRWRVALLDLVGFGLSDHGAYDPVRHAGLDGHAQDVAQVVRALADLPVVLVGHSVGTTVGLLADLLAPGTVAAHAMVAPAPCFVHRDDYPGAFGEADIDALLRLQQDDMQGFARQVAALVAAQEHWAPLASELVASFCRADRRAAAQLAQATFAGDHRAALALLRRPTLLLQCEHDPVAPQAVGRWMQAQVPGSELQLLPVRGHCPHLTDPAPTLAALEDFLGGLQARGVLPGTDQQR